MDNEEIYGTKTLKGDSTFIYLEHEGIDYSTSCVKLIMISIEGNN